LQEKAQKILIMSAKTVYFNKKLGVFPSFLTTIVLFYNFVKEKRWLYQMVKPSLNYLM
jgi:hypothetical protein